MSISLILSSLFLKVEMDDTCIMYDGDQKKN
jgi:hypothetical protein